MAPPRFSPQDLDQIPAVAAQWGKIVARRAFGHQGPGLDVPFTALEQLAAVAAAGLTEGNPHHPPRATSTGPRRPATLPRLRPALPGAAPDTAAAP